MQRRIKLTTILGIKSRAKMVRNSLLFKKTLLAVMELIGVLEMLQRMELMEMKEPATSGVPQPTNGKCGSNWE